MKVVLAADRAGYPQKEEIKAYLEKKGYIVIDAGTTDPEHPLSYYQASDAAVGYIRRGEAERGIFICGTGAGMCINANKHQGIFAVVCESSEAARNCRSINDANVLTFGYRLVPTDKAYSICDAFLETEFVQGQEPDRAKYLACQQEKYRVIEKEMFRS